MKYSARSKFAASSVLVFFAFSMVWRIVILAFAVPVYMLPTPWMVLKAMLARFPELIQAFLLSAEAAGGGLLASILVGIGISLVFAGLPWVRKLLVPYTILLQTVPIVAISPLIVMWVGPGLPAVMLIAFVICLAPIIANTTQGLVNVDENLLQLFVMHNASGADVLRKLRLPNSLPYMFVGIPPASGSIQSGALRALAVTSKVRSPVLPDVPTIQESGLPDYEVVLWWGFFAPAGMAPELVTKFNKVIGEIIQEPETRGKLRQLGYETTGSTPEEFKAYLQSEITKWADVIKSGGLDTE